jgi:hypothetical protein
MDVADITPIEWCHRFMVQVALYRAREKRGLSPAAAE